MMTMTESLQISCPAEGITQITLNRPASLNAMTSELVQNLHDALDDIAVDRRTRVVVLTGAGRGFCAGLDLGGYGSAPHTDGLGRTQTALAVQKHIAGLIPKMRALPQPIIAAVNGAAAGGEILINSEPQPSQTFHHHTGVVTVEDTGH